MQISNQVGDEGDTESKGARELARLAAVGLTRDVLASPAKATNRGGSTLVSNFSDGVLLDGHRQLSASRPIGSSGEGEVGGSGGGLIAGGGVRRVLLAALSLKQVNPTT